MATIIIIGNSAMNASSNIAKNPPKTPTSPENINTIRLITHTIANAYTKYNNTVSIFLPPININENIAKKEDPR